MADALDKRRIEAVIARFRQRAEVRARGKLVANYDDFFAPHREWWTRTQGEVSGEEVMHTISRG